MKKYLLLLMVLIALPVIYAGAPSIDAVLSPVNGTYTSPATAVELSINVSLTGTNISSATAVVTFPNSSNATAIILSNASTDGVEFNNSFTTPAVLNTSDLGLTFGTYTVTFYANDTSNNVSDGTTTQFVIANNITSTSNAPADSNSTNATSQFFNCSATGSVQLVNMTINVYNSSGLINRTVSGVNGTSNTSTFTVPLSEGTYTWNCGASTQVNTTVSSNRTVIMDTTAPVITLTLAQKTQNTLRIDITNSESGSGVSSCTVDRSAATLSGTGGTQEIQELGLGCGNSYNYTVTCTDNAQNTGTKSQSFSTSSCSGGGGGGGSGTTTSTYDWSATFNVGTLESHTRSLQAGQRIKATIPAGTHHVGVESISGTSVTIVVESTPQEATLNVGETRKFDVDDDGTYDLRVTLVSVEGDDAEITVEAISEPVPEDTGSETPDEETETPPAPSTGGETPPTDEVDLDQEGSSWWILGVIIIILVIGGVLFYVFRRN